MAEKYVSDYNNYAGTLAKAILLIENSDVAGDYYKALGTAFQSLILAGNSVPSGTDTVALLDATQTLRNKTIVANDNTITGLKNASVAFDAKIDWSKVGNTQILTETAVSYLKGVTADVQSQLDALAGDFYKAYGVLSKTSDSVTKMATFTANEIKQALGVSSGDYATYNIETNGLIVFATYKDTSNGYWTQSDIPMQIKFGTTVTGTPYDYVNDVIITTPSGSQLVSITVLAKLIKV
jgi:hypothetical protein